MSSFSRLPLSHKPQSLNISVSPQLRFFFLSYSILSCKERWRVGSSTSPPFPFHFSCPASSPHFPPGPACSLRPAKSSDADRWKRRHKNGLREAPSFHLQTASLLGMFLKGRFWYRWRIFFLMYYRMLAVGVMLCRNITCKCGRRRWWRTSCTWRSNTTRICSGSAPRIAPPEIEEGHFKRFALCDMYQRRYIHSCTMNEDNVSSTSYISSHFHCESQQRGRAPAGGTGGVPLTCVL